MKALGLSDPNFLQEVQESSIVTNGLVFCVDATNKKSYPTYGYGWNDLKNTVTGTLISGISFNSGASGNFSFNGSNGYVSFGSSYTGLDLGDKSFQAWIKRPTGTAQIIVDKDFDNGSPNYGGWGLWTQGAGQTYPNRLWWWNHANLDIFDTGSASIPHNTWANVAVVYNSNTKTASFYINGVLNSSSGNASIVEKSSSGQLLTIGVGRAGTSNPIYYFSGNISSCFGYNRQLTSGEVLQNYNAGRNYYGI